MALNLKNREVEALAEELAQLTGTSKTEAIRQTLLEQKRRLLLSRSQDSNLSAVRFLEDRIWPKLPPGASRPITKKQEEKLLGSGPNGPPA